MQAVCAGLLAITLAGRGPVSAAAQQSVTAFVDVSVIPMDRERVLAGQTVVVQSDRVIAMGPTARVQVPGNALRVDGRGKFLMPGLSDMHVHLAMGDADPRRAERSLLVLLASGVTTIRNMDYLESPGTFTGKDLLHLRARVAAGDVLGPRIYTAGRWYTDSNKSVAENVNAYKAAGYDLIKVHNESDSPLAKLDSLVDAARRVGIPVAGHSRGGLAAVLQRRFASVEHLHEFPGGFPPIPNISLADTLKIPAVVAAVRKAGVAVTPTLEIVESGFTNFYSTQADTVAAAGMAVLRYLVRALQDAGVPLLLGTDAPFAIPFGKGAHQELGALVRAGLTPYQALVTGTRSVAAYFGTSDSVGTVTTGKRADLVLLDANPLTDIRHAEQIAGVMTAGRWLPNAEIERRLDAYAQGPAAPGSD